MELNLLVLSGRLATVPEVREFDGGSTLYRLLVTVRSTTPKARVDVIPVTLWNPTKDQKDMVDDMNPGDAIWVAGSVQRRFWSGDDGRRSRLEVIANEVVARVNEVTEEMI